MRIKLHQVEFCSTDVPVMDVFYRSVLDLEPEPAVGAAQVTAGGCAGKVAFVADGTTQLHSAEKDPEVGSLTGSALSLP
ncbi:hypothetical protein GCM10009416_38500 [Craurococcus roseus]|uniref:Glyoxalase-like domain-containing protein n=1 Tax=Craurococcus roseus TaxID=77585 RepID=A0ABP3QSE9_9PROT